MNKKNFYLIGAGVVILSGLFYFMTKNKTKNKKMNNSGKIAFEDKMNPFFLDKLKEIAKKINIPASWLSSLIHFETAGTFRPDIQNPTTKATGLIQFMPTTATALGTTTDKLKTMSGVEQLNYVYKYFDLPYNRNLSKKTFTDFYLIVFYPAANGKPDTYKFSQIVYSQNPVFHNEKGFFTKKDLENVLRKKYPEAYK